ncbi:MAG: GNAT family N-acetyltransferase [Chloroflexota bacterium]
MTSLESIIIRPFSTEDYAGIAAVDAVVSPSYAASASELERRDTHQEPTEVWNRFVAVDATDQVIGTANYGGRLNFENRGNVFSIFVNVLPEYQGKKIGARLYDVVLAELKQYLPYDLFTNILADDARTVRFLKERGFVDHAWEHASKIDLTAFDPTKFEDEVKAVTDQSIVLKTVLDLAGDPERNQKLFDLNWGVEHDPSLEVEKEKPSLENWSQYLEPDSDYVLETCIVACDGDKYIGSTALQIYEGTELETGLTGVSASYRRRGIATAIKVHSLRTAKKLGYTAAYTWSDSANHAMININLRLGFVEQPVWVMMKKSVTSQSSD